MAREAAPRQAMRGRGEREQRGAPRQRSGSGAPEAVRAGSEAQSPGAWVSPSDEPMRCPVQGGECAKRRRVSAGRPCKQQPEAGAKAERRANRQRRDGRAGRAGEARLSARPTASGGASRKRSSRSPRVGPARRSQAAGERHGRAPEWERDESASVPRHGVRALKPKYLPCGWPYS